MKRTLQIFILGLVFLAALPGAVSMQAQSASNERSFPQSKAAVEKALQQIQPSLSGRLPALEGFAAAGEHPLNAYRRGFYQVTTEIISTAPGATVVRLTAKVTAWYADSVTARSGYQVLNSNGRLEADLLDQLSDQLALPTTAASKTPPRSSSAAASKTTATPEAAIATPMPRLPDSGGTFSSSLSRNLSANTRPSPQPATPAPPEADAALKAEAASLEEILKNQAHPRNLVAVKQSGTPVVPSPSLTAKTMFFASAHDEFEMLDFNRDWVHVRISGLSRGWIWRNSLEMPDSVPDSDSPIAPAVSPAAEMFHVSREETAPFPGDWEPLRGKSVKIVSVEKADENAKGENSQLRLEFAKSVLDQNYNELSKKSDSLAGIVVIFDSADGGMIAATLSTLQQWKAGHLSDAALWHQCFFDPPETFVPAGSAGSK